jgi:hypothetical protein
MRLLILISTAVLFFTFSACEKDDCTVWQTVTVTGTYTNTPDLTGGFHSVTLPDGSMVSLPKKYAVGGSDNVIGTVDASKSTLEVTSVSLNPKTGSFDSAIHITLIGSAGDQIHLKGSSQVYADNTGVSWFHYSEGTSKFADITGWLNATSVFNPGTGVNNVSATGEATYKK